MICWRELLRDLPEPWLVMVCGLVGVGKSTIAQDISHNVNAKYLSTDHTGYLLFGAARRYDEAYYARVYAHLIGEAKRALEAGRHVVLDGTFLKTETRRRIMREFQRTASLWIVYVTCDEEVVRARLANRAGASLAGRAYSEAAFDIYLMMKEKLLQNREYRDPRGDGLSLISVDTTSLPWSIVEKRVALRLEVP